MNWSHSETDLLNDDTTLWNGHQSGVWSATLRWLENKPPRMRFRLNGFKYRALAVGRVGRMIDKLSPAQTDPAGPRGGSQDDTQAERASTKGDKGQVAQDESNERVAWLCCQMPADLFHHFMAQPWTEAARVFRERGDYYEANRILHMREKYWHWALLSNLARREFLSVETWRKLGFFLFHLLFSRIAGFGYLIEVPIVLFVGIVLWWSAYYQQQFDAGLLMRNPEATKMKPGGSAGGVTKVSSNDQGWSWFISSARADGARQCPEPKECKPCTAQPEKSCPAVVPAVADASQSGGSAQEPAPSSRDRPIDEEYPAFNALAYSFDVMLPGVDISQGSYWIPGYRDADNIKDSPRVPFGAGPKLANVWTWYWVQIGLGWYLSIVIGLAATGLLERRGT